MIARVALVPIRLRLRVPLATARGAIRERDGFVLALEGADGACGYGEALPLAGWPGGSLAEVGAELASLAMRALGARASDALDAPRVGSPLACAALETALADLVARERRLSLAALLAGDAEGWRGSVAVNALITGETPEAVADAARTHAAAGMQAFKLKLGGGALACDLARVAALRDAIGARAVLRLDANGAWSEREAERALEALAAFAPEYVEEPVASSEACARLRRRGGVPIALDESASDAAAIETALRCGAADVLVLKPPLLGGPLATRAIARRALDAGVGVVVTSFLDSALGVAAALHCAASLQEATRAHGLATGALLETDLASLAPLRGELQLPDAAGLGVVPAAEALARVATGPRWTRSA